MGHLAGFSVEQEAALSICEARKDAAVAVLDAANRITAQMTAKPKRRPWWRIF